MELPIPLLVLSDAPDQHSGLAKITRDLCSLLVGQPEWRVASCGWMGRGSMRLPWQQYHMHPATFGEYDLPAIWDEFSSGQIGVIMTIWDLTRVQWLARPDVFDSVAREWSLRMRSRVRLWGYVPVDSTGPGSRLTSMSRETLLGFDRLLAYSPFGEEVIRNSIGAEAAAVRDLTWLPHGINGEVFHP